mmetsp:Transcript_40585/g.66687  ORF Transcript_40585/g.66687 Transcript_40585/m.66687 type:complete len:147 (+) Transcript_40585:28-468(+)|eukprot:CAMPEP_0202713720 /NCGR_PEP_ID=MMETSP1385-20130828/58313_1 /ASSEMBLY_ACC=CAM_ASM_000861 /TAXON_ID=933848 /ORGANISM="Elphidium margaritaceum" /LENGTH=146 /DNA_ID=CAMNT_0049374167 /DNA_START=27 /DNA_END=467 /DNA_ORIENTATION=-
MAGKAIISDEAEAARKSVWGRKAPFAVFELEEQKTDRIVKVSAVGNKGEDYKDLMKLLNDKNCRYFLYDYVSIDPKFNKKTEKTVFVFWSPPNCNQQMKMMYSAYLVNCRDDMKFAHHETLQDEDDFSMFDPNKKDDDDEDSEMSD